MASKKAAPEGPVEVPEIISILPLRNSVLFPGSIIPIDVGRKKSVKLVEEAISKERPVIGDRHPARRAHRGARPGDLYIGRLRGADPQGHQAGQGQLLA